MGVVLVDLFIVCYACRSFCMGIRRFWFLHGVNINDRFESNYDITAFRLFVGYWWNFIWNECLLCWNIYNQWGSNGIGRRSWSHNSFVWHRRGYSSAVVYLCDIRSGYNVGWRGSFGIFRNSSWKRTECRFLKGE